MVAAGLQVVRATTALSFAATPDCRSATWCSSPLRRAVRSVVMSNVAALPRRPGRFGAMWAGPPSPKNTDRKLPEKERQKIVFSKKQGFCEAL